MAPSQTNKPSCDFRRTGSSVLPGRSSASGERGLTGTISVRKRYRKGRWTRVNRCFDVALWVVANGPPPFRATRETPHVADNDPHYHTNSGSARRDTCLAPFKGLGIPAIRSDRHHPCHSHSSRPDRTNLERSMVMKGLFLWILGIPLPVILLLYLFDFL